MTIFQRLLVLAALLLCGQAQAIYVCDCQAGAHGSCVAGSNSNAGTSASSPKQTEDSIDFETLAAGTRVEFCRGGSWVNFSVFIRNFNATAASPITFTDYAPPSGATGCPLMQSGSNQSGFFVSNYNDGLFDGGYVFENLCLRGDGVNGSGVQAFSQVTDITVRNMDIRNYSIGVYAAGFAPSSGTGPTIVRMNVLNNLIQDNIDMGFLGGAADSRIEGNTFRGNNKSGSGLNHAIYWSSSPFNNAPAPRVIIRNNLLDRNSVNVTGPNDATRGSCTGGNLTARGYAVGLVVENNTIIQDTSAATCYGISMTSGSDNVEGFIDTFVRSNKVVNLGLRGIVVQNGWGVVVENNVVVNNQATYHEAITIEDGPDPEDNDTTFAVVRNNSVYMTQASNGSRGITTSAGTGHRISNNLMYFGASSSNGSRCFNVQPIGNYALFDYNQCFHGNNGGWTQSHSTLSAAQTAGYDTNGLNVDPLWSAVPAVGNDWTCNLQSGSTAINSGSSAAARLAYRGWRAVGTRDRGACEFGSTP